jgi:hypothetical protein
MCRYAIAVFLKVQVKESLQASKLVCWQTMSAIGMLDVS